MKHSDLKKQIFLAVLLFVVAGALPQNTAHAGTCEGLIGDLVWHDADCDGIQDDDESGIAGVTLHLKYNGVLIGSTTTNENGYYEFSPLCALDNDGNKIEWGIEVDTPPGYVPTQVGAPGSMPENDSDDHAGTIVILPDDGSSDITIDFGYCLDCGECEGKVTQLTLKYIGDVPDAQIMVTQKKEGKIFDETVQPSQTFDIFGIDKKGTLGTEIALYVNGELNTKIHTSCSQPIGPGLIKGDFEVIDGYSRNGGRLCPVEEPPAGGCECEGKVTELTLEYLGDLVDAQIVVKQKKDDVVVFEGIVQPNEQFTFVGADKKGTLGTDIFVYVNGELNTTIHTSCSQPIGPGLIKGDFEVIDGYSRNGGQLCPIEEPPQPPEPPVDECECEGKVTELTLEYLGDLVDVEIVVKQKKDDVVVFEGTVQPNEQFTFVGADKKGTLGTDIFVYVSGELNTTIHTSCSQPIGPGLIKGHFEVIDGYSRNGGQLCPL